MVSVEASEQRQRIRDWRDRWLLGAAGSLNGVTVEALSRIDRGLPEAGWYDTMLDRRAFVERRLAPILRDVAEPTLHQIVKEAAAELNTLDPDAATALLESGAEWFPSSVRELAVPPLQRASAITQDTAPASWQLSILRAASAVAGQAADLSYSAAETVSSRMRGLIGAPEWVRDEAVAQVCAALLDWDREPPSALARLMSIVDQACSAAAAPRA